MTPQNKHLLAATVCALLVSLIGACFPGDPPTNQSCDSDADC